AGKVPAVPGGAAGGAVRRRRDRAPKRVAPGLNRPQLRYEYRRNPREERTMAVLVIADIPGATVEQYEAVSRAIGFRDPGFEAPAGLISHTTGVDDEGVLIVDVWESAEDFERLMKQAVPAMQEVGVTPMEPRILPVHNRI